MSFGRDRKEPLSDTTKRDFTAVLMMIFLYSYRVKELLCVMIYSGLHLCLVSSLPHIWWLHCTGSTLLFALQIQMSVTEIFLLILGVSLIRCRLKGIPLFGVIGAFLAVMERCYSTGILKSHEIWKTITFSVLVIDTIIFVVVELHMLFKFTVKWFQNHIQGKSPHSGQDKFDIRKIEQALELFSFMVIGVTAFTIITTLLLLRPMANDLHAHHHILMIPVAVDRKWNFMQLMDASCDAFLYTALLYWNTLGNKATGIQELQGKIMSVAIEQQKRIITEHNIPLLWILIQDLIMKLKRNSDATFCVSFDEFQRMIMEDFVLRDKCSLSKDMLKYFHKIGLIIYVDKKQDFDLSNWILVCPEKLIDIFINISLKPAESTKYRGSLKYDWKLLQRKGILTKRLLHSHLSKLEKEEEAIIAFLKHYGLIYPLECKATAKYNCDIQPTHFVPSLLPLSANGDTPVWHNNDGDKKFYVFFCNFLPEALFHQLLSRAQKHSTLEFRNGKTVLYRDAGKFWMKPWLSYQLTLIEEEEMIEVTYNSSHKSKKEPSYVLGQVFLMIDGICKSYFPLVEFHCGPACPSETCPGYQDDYFTSLPTAEGNGTRRRHVYDIMPGRQGKQPVYLYCENNCLEDELYEWVPLDADK